MKLELDWHFTKDEMPELTEQRRNVEVFSVTEVATYSVLNYSKHGFNTYDWTGTKWEEDNETARNTAIDVRAWAYIPKEWDDIFFPVKEETEDETV